jgi:hypothetical protein
MTSRLAIVVVVVGFQIMGAGVCTAAPESGGAPFSDPSLANSASISPAVATSGVAEPGVAVDNVDFRSRGCLALNSCAVASPTLDRIETRAPHFLSRRPRAHKVPHFGNQRSSEGP